MKSMLRFFPALLAVWPYGILCIGLFEEDSAGSMVFLWVYCGLTAALLLFQILYCCLHRASARTFAFWNLKSSHFSKDRTRKGVPNDASCFKSID